MNSKTDEIMKVFYTYPEKKFHIRELARITKVSPAGVRLILKRLVKDGLLYSKNHGNMIEFEISRIEKYYTSKILNNINSLFGSGLVGFLRNVYDQPKAIILFGSYSDGTDTSESDIDIAIITNKKNPKEWLSKYEKKLKRNINIIEVDLNKADKKFLNNLANGFKLHGYVEWFK
jgi:predicted nucleotidyltransferase